MSIKSMAVTLAMVMLFGGVALAATPAHASKITENGKVRLCNGDNYVKHFDEPTRLYHKAEFLFWDGPYIRVHTFTQGRVFTKNHDRVWVNCRKY